MKAILELNLTHEQEELDAAVKAIEWKRCLEDISETVVPGGAESLNRCSRAVKSKAR